MNLAELTIESLDDKARGTAHINGQVVRCENVLPGETIRVKQTEQRRNYICVSRYALLTTSPSRVEPRCEYFGVCGGCQLQHIIPAYQLEFKLDKLRQQLAKQAGISPLHWHTPFVSDVWQYRRRVRLAVRFLPGNELIIGFRRKNHTYIQPVTHCEVLEPGLNALVPGLYRLIPLLSCASRIPRVEMVSGDAVRAIVIRHLLPLNKQDSTELAKFSEEYNVSVYTQAEGPDSIKPVNNIISSPGSELEYNVQGLQLSFLPTDFIQANRSVNEYIVNDALQELQLNANDKIADLFCGLGNFTLPVASRVNTTVAGYEVSGELLKRAEKNAGRNNLSNVEFIKADLFNPSPGLEAELRKYNKIILDPPREGAIELIKILPQDKIERIVYVSCNPRTLARDIAYLVHRKGYRLKSIRAVDMFPQTMHLETISVLVR